MSMINSTLCYIEKDGAYLMLHRVKKENDINRDKWIGIGGRFEFGESPEECVSREMLEETGLTPASLSYRGIVTFVYDGQCEYMNLFTCDSFTGALTDCDEGVLEWVPKEKLCELDLWEGDFIFLDLIDSKAKPFFSLKLVYADDGKLESAVLDGKPITLPYKNRTAAPAKPKAKVGGMTHVDIYTDGSCRKNPGPGGWGAVLVYGDRELELHGGDADTTNNRMELTSVIEALSRLKEPCEVTLTSDSKYVCDGISKGWAASWKKKGWKKSDGLCDVHKVTFVWVKGHAGHPYNERCDAMAQAESGKYL